MKSARGAYWLARLLTLFSGISCYRVASAIDLPVYNNNDNGAGSLRQAIQNNSALGGGNRIVFSNNVTGSITLLSGELLVDKSLTIVGPGAGVLAVSGDNSNRVFNVSSTVGFQFVALSGLTIANGRMDTNAGTGITTGSGAGILESLPAGILTVSQCILSNNNAANTGGGIFNLGGTLFVDNSTFVSNVCFNPFSGTVGGAIVNFGPAVVRNSTCVGNSAAYGGGIANEFGGTLALTNCTLTDNSARSQGGGLYQSGSTFTIRNTLVAGNTAPTSPDAQGNFFSSGYNLIGNGAGSSGFVAIADQVGSTVNPLAPGLGPLQDNGGPTPTMAPLPGGLAIDQGGSGGGATDQRGQPRLFDQPGVPNAIGGDGSDIGAVEVGPFLLVLNLDDHGPGSLRQAVLNAELGVGTSIGFASGLTGTITLTGGELAITTNLSISGPGANAVAVSGNNAGRAFNIAGTNVSISGLSLVGCGSTDACVRVFPGSSLALGFCSVVSNACAGIYSEGILTLLNSTLAYNTNTGFGGGLAHWDGTTAVTNCSFSENSARVGGGIYFDSYGSLSVDHCTIVSNLAAPGTIPSRFGGGIANFTTSIPTGHRVFIRDTIVAGNAAAASGPDVDGGFTSGGYNLIGKSDNSTGLTNGVNHDLVGSIAAPTNALVGPLQDNGGPTLTHALPLGSPALDAGSSFGLTTDQRGAPRPFDFASVANAGGGDGGDIGAFELGSPRLNIQAAAANVVISWPAYYGGFTLQSVTNFSVPIVWTPVPGSPQVIGSQYIVTNAVAGASRVYRLQQN